MDSDVSVIITCYNLDRLLDECVESVLAQTVLPKEIIIVHDGCKAPKVYDPKMVKVVCRTFNMGVAKSRDEGFRHSIGKYVLFVDADDVIPENFIQEALEHMKKADIVYPHILVWSHWDNSGFMNKWYSPKEKLSFDLLLTKNEVVVTSLMKRKVYEDIGGFDCTLAMYEDWEFFIKAYIKGFKFRRMSAFLKYRQRKDSRNRQSDETITKTFNTIKNKYLAYAKKIK